MKFLLAFLLAVSVSGAANAQGQALRCVSPSLASKLPPNTHLIQPAAGQLLARLQIGLSPVIDLYVIEGHRQAAIFYSDGRMLCGGIIVEQDKVGQSLLSVVHRFGA